MRWKLGMMLSAAAVLLAAAAPAANGSGTAGTEGGSTRYGDLEFPRDEHQKVTGWDYWWGAADVVAESGNRYTVGFAFNSHWGVGVTGHQVFPHQGPYAGQAIMTMDGPEEWGHEGEPPNTFVRDVSVHVPGVSELMHHRTLDPMDGLREIGSWERTTLDRESYRLRLDNARAKVHPSGEHVRLLVDLEADMAGPPLLAGGTGTWWYGIPETFGYPSRSFQYMQAAEHLRGTLVLEQPDGTMLEETVVPGGSTLVMTHEYDATPEDLVGGLALAQGTQLHPRYAQSYSGGMPWELLFLDLGNGAQLMVALLAFHNTPDGTLAPVLGPDQPTYRVLATLRLPSGESIPLDDVLFVEHLSYRNLVGRVPTFAVAITGVWTQAWTYRISFPGAQVTAPAGHTVEVPAFDLGVVPQFDQGHPAIDDRGNRQDQRVPFTARGSYAGCPVDGFGWSELIVNWYGYEDQDPWFTGGGLPDVPKRCKKNTKPPTAPWVGVLDPPRGEVAPPDLTLEGCTVYNPGPEPRCEYVAAIDGGVGGFGPEPGAWTVTITRPGRPTPIVITGLGGQEVYACGTIRPGDHVVAEAAPGGGAMAGNPGFCA